MIGENLDDVEISEVKKICPQWEDIARRTKYYHIDRYRLFKKVADKFGSGVVRCFECLTRRKLEFHHVDLSKSRTDLDGYKHFYKLKEHFEQGEEFEILCNGCHEEAHETYNLNNKSTEELFEEAQDEGVFGGLA